MPRISPQLIRQAHRISPHAATLLPATRDLPSTINELRWIRQHILATTTKIKTTTKAHHQNQLLATLCRRRGRGEPLQYVLGTQPFGPLEILCRKGVLIPRPEPEAYTTHLATILFSNTNNNQQPLRILDICTGTGCIALLLLHHALQRPIPSPHTTTIHGIDISPAAISLARRNAAHNNLPLHNATFTQGDIFSPTLLDTLQATTTATTQQWDVITCNPPYISPWGFIHQTARSVRNYEPKIAQVPPPLPCRSSDDATRVEDVFYARLVQVAARLRPRVMLCEVGDLEQALRVVEMVFRHQQGVWKGDGTVVEVWRDWPDAAPGEDEQTTAVVDGKDVRIRGCGHGRSVFIQFR